MATIPDNDEKAMLEEALKTLKPLHDIADYEGVKLLAADAKSIVVGIVSQLSSGYADLSEVQLRSLCATLRANLEVYQKITGIGDEVAAIEKALNPEGEKKE